VIIIKLMIKSINLLQIYS